MRKHLTAILGGAFLFSTTAPAASRATPQLVCVGDDAVVTGKLCAAVAQQLKLDTWSQDPAIDADMRVEVVEAQPNRISARLGTRQAKGYLWGPEVTTAVMDAESLPASAFAQLARSLTASMSDHDTK